MNAIVGGVPSSLIETAVTSVEAAVLMAASSLRESLAFHWPTRGDTGVLEKNISLHVAHALLSDRYVVFGESRYDSAKRQHIDLVAFSRNVPFVVLAEFKQLWTPGIATKMGGDFERIRSYRSMERFDLTGHLRVGVLAAFASRRELYSPFSEPLSNGGHPAVRSLCASLPAEKKLGAVRLSEQFGKHPEDRKGRLHLVYAVFPL